jgi:hypothetical protein
VLLILHSAAFAIARLIAARRVLLNSVQAIKSPDEAGAKFSPRGKVSSAP